MDAIHILSAAPFFAGGGKNFRMDDFDLYCAALSALEWRKKNGRITLCADKASAEYIEGLGLSELWNDVQICVPDDLDGINPLMFWAGGKLLALRSVSAPVVMLDTDFIVWERLDFGKAVIAAHREELSEDIYPPCSFFKTSSHILPEFDENVLPLNTAFLYLPDNDFKEFYTSQAIAFMRSAADRSDRLRYMVFAEQRMAAMCAEYTGTPVDTLLDKDRLFFPQERYTHLWGAKQKMRDEPALRKGFLEKCRARLLKDFPEYEHIAARIEGGNVKRALHGK